MLKLEDERLTARHDEPAAWLPGPSRAAQQVWAAVAIRQRLSLLRRARHRLAGTAIAIAQSVPCDRPGALHRSVADTLVAEVLPLVEALRFLEREAAWILSPRRLSNRARPFWLSRVTAETVREPLGVVLIIAPANYPLFLPGVQALQALAAGNAVLWKPAPGGTPAAQALRAVLVGSGLDPALLQVLDESPQAAANVIAAGTDAAGFDAAGSDAARVDKVFLTGSAATGAAVLGDLAPHLTPSVMELSGCDAVFVLPGADADRVIEAVRFGLGLNGSATCMAPRRLFLVGEHAGLLPRLLSSLEDLDGGLDAVALPAATQASLSALVKEAEQAGATVQIAGSIDAPRYVAILQAAPGMRVAQADIFAPVLSVFASPNVETAITAHAVCRYALTAAIFGPEKDARALAARLPVNMVLINDVIVATADPRLSFGGRKASGFGLTRGPEGLLEMTTLKTVVVQGSRDRRAYRPTNSSHESLFAAYLEAVHSAGWRARWSGLCRLARAATRIDRQN